MQPIVTMASFSCFKVSIYVLTICRGRTRSTSAVARIASKQEVPDALSQFNS